MDKAVQLLSFDAEGAKWQIQEHAIRILKEIQEPVTVISIIGNIHSKIIHHGSQHQNKICFRISWLNV